MSARPCGPGRGRFRALLATVAAYAMVGGIAPEAQAQVQALRIEPGTVTHGAAGVAGSFRARVHKDGDWSTGTGGACLLADLSASLGEFKCSQTADCDAAVEAFKAQFPPGAAPAGAWGYCARAQGDDGGNRCWLRPGPRETHCVLSAQAPLALDTKIPVPAPAAAAGAPAFPLGDGKPVRWMVYACLNHHDFSSTAAPKDLPGCPTQNLNQSTVTTGRARTLRP